MKKRLAKAIGYTIGFFGGLALMSILLAWVIESLWNYLAVLGLPRVTFWQAAGIYLLTGLLFRSVKSS